MPTYILDGVRAGNRNITPVTLEVDFKRGSEALRFEVIPGFEEDGYIRVTSGNVRKISLDGTEVSGDTPGTYTSVVWGAGLFTEVFGLELLDGRDFAAFLSGTAVPAALVEGGRAAQVIGAEFIQSIAVNEFLTGGIGPQRFEPDADVPLEVFFEQDLDTLEIPGTNARDVLTGDSRANVLTGMGGGDVLKGRGGDDTIFTGRGDDTGLGGGGDDMITGFTGDDRLNGQGGRDVILGGAGNDVLKGGSGADMFVFARGDGTDVIRDFFKGNDGLVLDIRLSRGLLDADQITAKYGEMRGDDFVLDFGKRGEIIVEGAAQRRDDVADAIEVSPFFF